MCHVNLSWWSLHALRYGPSYICNIHFTISEIKYPLWCCPHFISYCVYVRTHSYYIPHLVPLFLINSSWSSLMLHLSKPHIFEVFFQINWLSEWILHIYIIDCVSVFLYLYMLGNSSYLNYKP